MENNSFLIIHNPRCSKSREALKLIEERGLNVQIIDYLNGELTQELLERIIQLLGIPAKEILRTKEEEYASLQINLEDHQAVIKAILACPKLLERPIVVKDNQAVIGRPPENILPLLTH